MPMTKDTTTTKPPSPSTSSSCFLGCFGCSGEKTRLKEEVNSGGRRRRRSWISSFGFKKSPTKTVPVDLKPVNDDPATSNTIWEIQVVEENATLTEKRTNVDGKQALIISREKEPCLKKWTTGGQKKTKLATKLAPGPGYVPLGPKTVTMTHPFVSSPMKALTHSKPLPQTKRQKPPHVAHTTSGVDGVVLQSTTPSSGDFDSIVGMSIILVILVILVLWGKLCAILCTSAWFFIVRRLVAVGERSVVDTAGKPPPEAYDKLDLESEEYKKKVILEGFLQRNNRKLPVGRL